MSDFPLVSILINNYNYGRFLRDAIDSALNQTYSNVEVIVVDDGSTDNSRSVIESYDSKILSIFKPNGGQASAFNSGFSASKGEIIFFLDADDIFQPSKVETIVEIFMKHTEIGWCFHTLELFDQISETCNPFLRSELSGVYDLSNSIQKKGKLNGKLPFAGTATSGMCFKSSFLETILPMPETSGVTLSDDYIKYVALGLKPGFILLQNLALQRIHGSNRSTLKKDKKSLKLKSEINISTAYWMKTNFPVLQNFSDKILALGIYLSWNLGETLEPKIKCLIEEYFSKSTLLRRTNIYLRAFYYYLK